MRYFIARRRRCRSVLGLWGCLSRCLRLLGHHASEHHSHVHHGVHLLIIRGLGGTTHLLLLLALHNVELHQLLMVLLNSLLLHDDHLLVVQVLLLNSHSLSSSCVGCSLGHHRHHWHHRHHTGHHAGHLGYSLFSNLLLLNRGLDSLNLFLFLLGSLLLVMVLFLGFGLRLSFNNSLLDFFDDCGNDLLNNGLRLMLFNGLIDHGFCLGLNGVKRGQNLFSTLLYFGLVHNTAIFFLRTGLTLSMLGFLGLLRDGGTVNLFTDLLLHIGSSVSSNSDLLGFFEEQLNLFLLLGWLRNLIIIVGVEQFFNLLVLLFLVCELLSISFQLLSLTFFLLIFTRLLLKFVLGDPAGLVLSFPLLTQFFVLALLFLAFSLNGLLSAVVVLLLARLGGVPLVFFETLVLVVCLIRSQMRLDLVSIEIEINANLSDFIILQNFNVFATVCLPLLNKLHLFVGHFHDFLVATELFLAKGSGLLPVRATTATSAAAESSLASLASEATTESSFAIT